MKETNSVSFAKACIEKGITELNTSASKEKAKLIAKQNGIVNYEDMDSLQRMIDFFLERERKEKEDKRIKAVQELKEQEIKKKNELEKYADLIGRDKGIRYYEDIIKNYDNRIAIREDAIESANTIKKVYSALNASIEPIKSPPKEDWATAAGIASALGGPAAGLAVASDIQRRNAESRIDPVEAAKSVEATIRNNTNTSEFLSQKVLNDCSVSSEEYQSAKKSKEIYIKNKAECELLLVDNTVDQYHLLNALSPSIVSKQITESGSVHLVVEVKGDIYNIFENVPAIIDGSFKALLWNEKDECCGVASIVLPVSGVKDKATIEAWFTDPQINDVKYDIEFTKPNLWLIECSSVAKSKHRKKIIPLDTVFTKNAEQYYDAYSLMKSKDLAAVERAYTIFDSLDNWKDANSQKTRCQQLIQQLEEKKRHEAEQREQELQAERKRQEKIKQELLQKEVAEKAKKAKRKKTIIIGCALALISVVVGVIITQVIIPNKQEADTYAKAMELYSEGKYDEAIDVFNGLGDYKNTSDMLSDSIKKVLEKALSGDTKSITVLSALPDNYYNEHPDISYGFAQALASQSDWAGAEKYYRKCGNYESAQNYSIYYNALGLVDNGDYDNAIIKLQSISGFLDSDSIVEELYYQKVISVDKMDIDDAISILSSAPKLNKKGQELYDICIGLQKCTGRYLIYQRQNQDGTYKTNGMTYDFNISFYLQEGTPYIHFVKNSLFHDSGINDAPVESGDSGYTYMARCSKGKNNERDEWFWFSETEAKHEGSTYSNIVYYYRKWEPR